MGDGTRVLITGGTFDKVYSPITEKLEFTESCVPELLRKGRNRSKVELEVLMLKDSLYMTDSDRQLILERCKGCLEDRILITHGTGTMVDTATVLGQNLENKTVVLTGAMVPYRIKGTDAEFNFAFAYGLALYLPVGVYIAMNGRRFYWNNVRKNTELGEFEELKPSAKAKERQLEKMACEH